MTNSSIAVNKKLAEYAVRGWANWMANQSCVFALLKVPIGSIGCSFDSGTDQITTAAAQTWLTKTKVRFVDPSGGIFGPPPSLSPLSVSTDYYLIRDSSTTFKVAASRADAIAGTFIQLPTIASGSYNVVVQTPNDTWPIAELADWEITHPLYTARYSFPYSVPAPVSTGGISTQTILVTTIDNTSAVTFEYNAIAILDDAGSAPGDTGFGTIVVNVGIQEVSNGLGGFTSAAPTSIAAGIAPTDITYTFSAAYT
jgi:hypothetical protein